MDLVMSHQMGITNVVAVSGTSLTEKHIDLLRRFARTLVLAFDSDQAGQRASERAWQIALAKDIEVKVVSIDGGKDPADLIKEDPELWKNALTHQLHIIEYQLKRVAKAHENDERTRNRTIESEVLPYIAVIASPIEQAHFLRMVSLQTGISEKTLGESVSKISVIDPVSSSVAVKANSDVKGNRLDIIERKIAALLVWHKDGVHIREKLKNIDNNLIEKLDVYIRKNEEELKYEAEVSFQNAEHLDLEIRELLRNIEEEILKKQLAEAMVGLKRAEASDNKSEIQKLLKRCQEISIQLHTLKKPL